MSCCLLTYNTLRLPLPFTHHLIQWIVSNLGKSSSVVTLNALSDKDTLLQAESSSGVVVIEDMQYWQEQLGHACLIQTLKRIIRKCPVICTIEMSSSADTHLYDSIFSLSGTIYHLEVEGDFDSSSDPWTIWSQADSVSQCTVRTRSKHGASSTQIYSCHLDPSGTWMMKPLHTSLKPSSHPAEQIQSLVQSLSFNVQMTPEQYQQKRQTVLPHLHMRDNDKVWTSEEEYRMWQQRYEAEQEELDEEEDEEV